jgi:hypothetical protein
MSNPRSRKNDARRTQGARKNHKTHTPHPVRAARALLALPSANETLAQPQIENPKSKNSKIPLPDLPPAKPPRNRTCGKKEGSNASIELHSMTAAAVEAPGTIQCGIVASTLASP